MNKVIRNGEVAVLYSPGYGAGWYSWNKDFPQCLFEPRFVELVEQKEKEIEEASLNIRSYTKLKEFARSHSLIRKMEELAAELYGENFYSGGARDLSIEWICEGQTFKIREYDGSESVDYCSEDYLKA